MPSDNRLVSERFPRSSLIITPSGSLASAGGGPMRCG